MATYEISFLSAAAFGDQIDRLNGTNRNFGSSEVLSLDKRGGKEIETGDFDQSDYVTVTIEDNDTIFNDASATQKLVEPLTIGATTYPAGTVIHVGFRLDIDLDEDGEADESIWTINVDGRSYGQWTTIGVASTVPLPPNATFKIVGGGDNNDANIADPSQLYCFATGTLIATPAGERAVETLAAGEMVATADGGAVPVRWIGRQTVRRADATGPRAPVRIAAGALGGGLPRRDLVVTGDHALILDGLAITAAALIDGRGIRRLAPDDLPERATFYHIETDAHDVVLAEGAPAETWVDHGDRARFDNYDEYLRLYGADRRIPESPLPRITAARQLPPALRARLGLTPTADAAA